MNLIHRVSLFCMAAFFFWAALKQFDDPDPYFWIPVYLVPSVLLFGYSIFQVNNTLSLARNIAFVALLILAVAFALLHWSIIAAAGTNFLDIEEGRELGGLVTAVFALSLTFRSQLHETIIVAFPAVVVAIAVYYQYFKVTDCNRV